MSGSGTAGRLLADGGQYGAARRHQRRLGVRRQGQRLFGAFQDEAREGSSPPSQSAGQGRVCSFEAPSRAAADASRISFAIPTLCEP